MADPKEVGGIEFERDPSKKRDEDKQLANRPGKSQPDSRQTDPAIDFERTQQPVVNHQDRQRK